MIYLKTLCFLGFLMLVSSCGSNPKANESNGQTTEEKLPDCQWCGAMDAPADLSWQAYIADMNEPGAPLTLSGQVFMPDGKTPAEGITVYAYHTNTKGAYEKKGNETGNGKRHGHLRGWAKTNADGKYQFVTIRPAPYPSHNEPAHIHMTLSGKGIKEYWINSTWFEGDSLITEALKAKLKPNNGFSNIIPLKKTPTGEWQGTRNITLQKNK